METGLMLFTYEDKPVRTVIGENGEVLWVAKDVCDVLGIEQHRNALQRLDDDQVSGGVLLHGKHGKRKFATITVSGVYELIFQSRKPEARAFRKWVTSEVLPTLFKTGEYHLPSDLQQRLQSLQQQIEERDQKLQEYALEVRKQQNMINGQQQMVDVFCRVLGDTDERADAKGKQRDDREPLTEQQRCEVLKWYEKGHDAEEITFLTKLPRRQVKDVMRAHDDRLVNVVCLARADRRG